MDDDKYVVSNFSAKDIFSILKNQEADYIEKEKNNTDWGIKHRKLKKFLEDLLAKNHFTIEDFELLKSFALSFFLS